MIFSAAAEHRKQRELNRHKLVQAIGWILPVLYVVAALKIAADTGLHLWDVQFWLILLPFVVLSEKLLYAFAQSSRTNS